MDLKALANRYNKFYVCHLNIHSHPDLFTKYLLIPACGESRDCVYPNLQCWGRNRSLSNHKGVSQDYFKCAYHYENIMEKYAHQDLS